MHSRFHRALFPLLALWLTGCVGGSAIPEQRFYRLPEPHAAAPPAQPLAASLGIPRLQAGGLYHERAILHFVPEQPLELRPYHYHYWADAPGALIRDHLAAYLSTAQAAGTIVRFQDEGRAERRLHGRLLRFEREVGPERVAVHVALEFRLEAGRRTLLPAKRYDAHREAATRAMHDTIEAFGAALEEIYRQLLADLAE